MNEAIANQLYDVLVNTCGAAESYRDHFIYSLLKDKYPMTEFRFGGKLGMGGKFWRNSNRFYVTCYSLDEYPEERAIIDQANEQLAVIRSTVEGVW